MKEQEFSKFRPFADDVSVANVGGLTIENDTGRIAVHGQLEIAAGQDGASTARLLAMLFAKIADAAEAASVASIPPDVAAGEVDSPFKSPER